MNIQAQENYIQFDGYRFTKNNWAYHATETGAFWFQFPGTGQVGIVVPFQDIRIDGEEPADRETLIAFLNSNLVFKSGGGTGEGVQGITGELVDNTDPLNPVVKNPTWDDVDEKPTSFPPSAHTHTIAQINDLENQLNAKQPSGSYATTSQLTAGLAEKADSGEVSNLIDEVATKLTANQGVAVADAVDDTDIVGKFNALLSSLRDGGSIAM